MSNDPNKQYPPPQWDHQRGAYPVPPQQAINYRAPPPHPHPPPPQAYQGNPSAPGEMVTLPPPQHQPPPHPDMYRMPHDMYAQYQPNPHGPPHQMYQSQPAPRQRTAIACRYCRRRKIRCSGFDASEDGRCTNCQRFQQECIFTPVSSQAQAFVPAHTAYPHLRQPLPPGPQRAGRPLYPHQGQQPAIYGAHGQPLGPPMSHDPNYPPPPPHGYPMPPQPYPGPVYDDRGAPPPPPPPHPQDKSYPSAPYPPPGQAYYPPPTQAQQPPPPQHAQQSQPSARRTSPPSYASSYDARGSGSPHDSASSTSGYYNPQGLHPPQVLPEARTPPPGNRGQEGNGNGSGQRGGMAVRDLLGPGQTPDSGSRSSADSTMLSALNKKM